MHPSPTGDLTAGVNMGQIEAPPNGGRNFQVTVFEGTPGVWAAAGLYPVCRRMREAGDVAGADAVLDAVLAEVEVVRTMVHRSDPLPEAAPATPAVNVTVCCPECGHATIVPAGALVGVGGLWCQSCGTFLRARVG